MKHIDESMSPSTVLSMESSSPSPEVEVDLSVLSVHSTPPNTVKPQDPTQEQTSMPPMTTLAAASGLPFITSPLLDSAALVMTTSRVNQPLQGVRYSFKPYPTLREQLRMFSGRDKESFHPTVVSADTVNVPVLPTERISAQQAIISRPSFRLHQKPAQPLSRIASIRRKQSIRSTAASHGCNHDIVTNFCSFFLQFACDFLILSSIDYILIYHPNQVNETNVDYLFLLQPFDQETITSSMTLMLKMQIWIWKKSPESVSFLILKAMNFEGSLIFEESLPS